MPMIPGCNGERVSVGEDPGCGVVGIRLYKGAVALPAPRSPALGGSSPPAQVDPGSVQVFSHGGMLACEVAHQRWR
jgi:hypothetical protein